ncbi:hypothetical protein HDU99_007627 [Rhizoclosmatium hyalinum]|nr:hypothetical protein HDU99_007627 [Rhizoclosmatium hyalinum]
MDAIWWPFIEQGDAGKEVLAERLNQAVAFVKRIETEEGSFAGTMKPLVRCMESMEDEINCVLRDGRSSSMETALQEMELGMTVMSLGDNVTEYSPSSSAGLENYDEIVLLHQMNRMLEIRESVIFNHIENPVTKNSAGISFSYGTHRDHPNIGQHSSIMETYWNALQEPLTVFETNHWEIEDPDLLPTMVNKLLSTRKSVFRCPIIPSVETAFTYFAISTQALRFGAINLQGQFLKVALDLVLELQMDIDPDDLPQCAHLSSREKEERRRIFWILLLDYCYELPINDEQPLFPLLGDKVKAPSQVYDPAPVFLELSEEVKWRAGLENLIGITKRHFIRPPSSIHDVLNSAVVGPLWNVVTSTHEGVPGIYLLEFDHPSAMTVLEEEKLLNQIFKPAYCSNAEQAIIINAIEKCWESAWRIFSLYLFFAKMGKKQSKVPSRLFNLHGGLYHVLEAYIVFWFVTCRMEPVWATLAGLENYNNIALLERMKEVLEIRDSVSSSEPYSSIMKAMLAEVVDKVREGKSTNLNDAESIEVGMEAMRISRDQAPSDIVDMRWFMGFLGMEVRALVKGKRFVSKAPQRNLGDYFGS